MNQDQARRLAEEVLELADDYAEARHTKGDRSYNAETAAKREAIAATLVKLTQHDYPAPSKPLDLKFEFFNALTSERLPDGDYQYKASLIRKDGKFIEIYRESLEAGNAITQFIAPSQQEDRKPLTDEQIHAASLQAGMQEHYMDFHSGFIRFARAIEAAHNIKEQK